MRKLKYALSLICVMFLLAFTLCAQPARAMTDEEETVERARTTAESLFSDPNYPTLLSLASKARAILIIPNMVRIGFFIGGRGGTGVLLVRGADGKWSEPAFYTLGGLNYGLQIGGQASQIIITIMTEKGLNAVLKNELTLGADANVAIGMIGAGAQASTGLGMNADMYAFARSEGLYVGVALDGTVLDPSKDANEKFYATGATPEDILLNGKYKNPAADKLVAAMPK